MTWLLVVHKEGQFKAVISVETRGSRSRSTNIAVYRKSKGLLLGGQGLLEATLEGWGLMKCKNCGCEEFVEGFITIPYAWSVEIGVIKVPATFLKCSKCDFPTSINQTSEVAD